MSSLVRTLLCKCHNCGGSNLFKHSSFNILKFTIMNEQCPKCAENFHPEPGFYLGAMYISYVFNSFLFLFIALTLVFYFEKSLTFTFTVLGLLSLIILPITLRVSRSIWLLINFKFSSNSKSKL